MISYPYKLINVAIESPILERSGGPATYLYNLREGLTIHNIQDIGFYSPLGNRENPTDYYNNNVYFSEIKKVLKGIIRKLGFCEDVYIYKNRLVWYRLAKETEKILSEMKELKVIHLHSSLSFYYLYNFIKGKGYKTILTSHTPEAPFLEYMKNISNTCKNVETDDFTELSKLLKVRTIDFLKKITYFSFHNTDYLLFPSEESMEPYFETFPDFEKIISNKRLIFVPTGVPEICLKEPDFTLKRKLGIPENATIVLFIGRHNKVKGYDILQEAAKIVWLKNKSVYFVILGKEYPLKGLNDTRWIEIGWKNNISDYISISDIFVLPNRRTYFDLVLLEVMSCKKVAVVSNTGGNKFISKLSKGVVSFKRGDHIDLADKILELAAYKKDEREQLGAKNYLVYKKYFTIEKFAENYISQVYTLLSN